MDYYKQIDTSEHGQGRVVFKRVPNVSMEPYSVRGWSQASSKTLPRFHFQDTTQVVAAMGLWSWPTSANASKLRHTVQA